MNRSETTNGKLESVLAELETLIEWAKSDAQHALENDAPDTARDDGVRAAMLRQAAELIAGCGR